MSVLLEALKRAALEKKGGPSVAEPASEGTATSAISPAPATLTAPSTAPSVPETATTAASTIPPPAPQSILAEAISTEAPEPDSPPKQAPVTEAPHDEEMSMLEVLEEDELGQYEEVDIEALLFEETQNAGEMADEISLEIAEARSEAEEDAEHDTSVSTTSVNTTSVSNTPADTSETETILELFDQRTLQASSIEASSPHDVEVALREAAVHAEREKHDRAEQEAVHREAERSAFLLQQKQQDDLDEVDAATNNEQEEARIRGDNETELTKLVHMGHELNRRQKRRSRFLYAMLVMTALGGIVSYYFYLLGNNSLQRLLTRSPVAQDVGSLIGREQRGEVGAVVISPVTDEIAAATGSDEVISIDKATSSDQAGSMTDNSQINSASVAAASVVNTDQASPSNMDMPVSSGATSFVATVARRADQPPSANLIFRQFVESAKAPFANTVIQQNETSGEAQNLRADEERIDSSVIDTPLTDTSLTHTPLTYTPLTHTPVTNQSRIDNASIGDNQSNGLTERVHIFHKATPTQFSALIQQAYSAFQDDDFTRAERLYSEALGQDPRNRDAILGAAAVAAAKGELEDALRLYQLRLNQDPTDSYAKAGLLTLSNHATLDTRAVDELLRASPGAAHLHFLKGAIHAANADWKQAQAAFFEAHHWDKSNPDYAYNLAVSLDHLGQTASAARFYQQALNLADTNQSGFSTQSAARRLDEIGGTDG